MWDTFKFIIGLIIMAIIIVICYVVKFCVQLGNPVFVIVGLVAFLIYDITSGE